MRIAFMRMLTTGAMTAAILLSTTAMAAEAPAKVPRLPNGKPNLSGIWQTMNTANYDLEPHSARAALALVPGQFNPVPAPEVVALGAVGAVPGGLGVVEGNTIPYKPEMLAKKQENQKNWLTLDPEIKCYLPGVPRANYMPFPFQISHNKDYLFFAYEYAGAVRNVYLKDPGAPPTESWMGQSFGRWEGDTMVVDVVEVTPMRNMLLVGTIAAIATGLLAGTASLAHHAFAAEFDGNKPVNLRGVVTKVEWINPHAWIHIDAAQFTNAGCGCRSQSNQL